MRPGASKVSERHTISVEYQPTPESIAVSVEHDQPRAEVKESGPEFIETARRELELAAETAQPTRPELVSSGEHQQVRITPKDKLLAYQQTVSVIQRGLPPMSRSFSKFIHQPNVERLSELSERTIARPSAQLAGGLIASLGLAIMLYFSRRNGFALSGSELLLFLLAGWSLGLGLEFVITKLAKRR